jgi:hypothetical protein
MAACHLQKNLIFDYQIQFKIVWDYLTTKSY